MRPSTELRGRAVGPKLFISTTIRKSEGDKRIFFMAFLGAMAISFSIIESMVPKPLPWMRIGLANAITLYSFTVLRPREVLPVAPMHSGGHNEEEV